MKIITKVGQAGSFIFPALMLACLKIYASCYISIRVGHAYAEYAVHADYSHMRKYADADENLIHIIHIWIFAKNGNFLGQK